MPKKYGTRLEVWKGVAAQTRYGLTRKKLSLSKKGKVVSKVKASLAKKKSNLGKYLHQTHKLTKKG